MIGNNKPVSEPKKSNRKRNLLIIICVFLALLLVFGTVLGIIIGVKNSRAVFSYKGTRLGEGEVNFFASYYKYRFIAEFAADGAEDADWFWESEYDGDTTYGELLVERTEEYIKNITVAAYLYDSLAGLTDDDKRKIKVAAREVLDFKAEGSEEKFNSQAAAHGFDYDSFSSATEILYKATFVMSAIYGEDGTNVLSFPGECNEFYEKYAHVKLLFIRTEDKFLLDENGNRVRDENNNDTLVALTDSEKARRQETIAEIREAIVAYENDSDDKGQMSPTYFAAMQGMHDEGDAKMINSGYYFYAGAAYTREFVEEFSDVVKASLEMEKDSYREVAFSGGVCFIYKYANDEGAYLEDDESGCFSDFFSLCASASFNKAVDEIKPMVKVKDSFYEKDLIDLPYNYVLVPRF